MSMVMNIKSFVGIMENVRRSRSICAPAMGWPRFDLEPL
jgi:hypothetical protein